MYGIIHTTTLKVYIKASKRMNIDEQIWDNVVNRTEKIWRELESIYVDNVWYGVRDKIRDNVSMIAWDSVKRNVWQNVKRQSKNIK
jgi:hypothetical protein